MTPYEFKTLLIDRYYGVSLSDEERSSILLVFSDVMPIIKLDSFTEYYKNIGDVTNNSIPASLMVLLVMYTFKTFHEQKCIRFRRYLP